MKIEKLSVADEKLNINLQFYYFQKQLIKAKLNDNQIDELLKKISINKKTDTEGIIRSLADYIQEIKSDDRRSFLENIISSIKSLTDIDLLIFCLKLSLIRDLLLQEAKLKERITSNYLQKLDPLSLEYDNLSVKKPYTTRVNGALLSLLFFDRLEKNEINFMSQDACEYLKELSNLAIILMKKGLEPNQIFMLMFTESMNQSIISDSGSNYEDRILTVLKSIGIQEENIKKVHDKADASTEFDFFFELGGRTYGIGAKRTLRERYKQFIKTAQTSKIDVMIEITLGLDLNEAKAKTILGHSTYLFVADEIYNSRKFLQKLDGVHSVKKISLELLKSLK